MSYIYKNDRIPGRDKGEAKASSYPSIVIRLKTL
jgi:hypothetical protein